MMNQKALAQIGRKWQRFSALGRKRLQVERQVCYGATDQCTTLLAQKGHCVVYTVDEKRFEIPLDYFNCAIRELLFKHLEEEFGYTAGGCITLACDGDFMEYLMNLVQRRVPEVERAVANLSFFPCHQTCSLTNKIGDVSQHLEVC